MYQSADTLNTADTLIMFYFYYFTQCQRVMIKRDKGEIKVHYIQWKHGSRSSWLKPALEKKTMNSTRPLSSLFNINYQISTLQAMEGNAFKSIKAVFNYCEVFKVRCDNKTKHNFM